jgi:drug/metabolite transporter (DMT)-like permease
VGIFIAFTGIVYLVLPSVTTPSFFGFALMSAAGIAWGIYTLKGKTSTFPLCDTAFNFARTTPFILALALLAIPTIHLSAEGMMLAILSGAIASGIGYTVWYVALGGLSATEAAVVQLLVPVIAAVGGIVFVSEAITVRLLLAAVMILGGILTVVLGRWYFVQLRVAGRS